jgi:hypothetical protein
MTRAAGQPSVVIGFRLAGLAPQIAIIMLGRALFATFRARNGIVMLPRQQGGAGLMSTYYCLAAQPSPFNRQRLSTSTAGRRWKRPIKPALLMVYVALGGCATSEQINARHDATCRSWGSTPGTDTYIQCRALLSQQQANEDQARRDRAAILSGVLLSR